LSKRIPIGQAELHNGSSGCCASVSQRASRLLQLLPYTQQQSSPMQRCYLFLFGLLYYYFSLYACVCLYSWNERTNERQAKK
jgi:hypothetical protein